MLLVHLTSDGVLGQAYENPAVIWFSIISQSELLHKCIVLCVQQIKKNWWQLYALQNQFPDRAKTNPGQQFEGRLPDFFLEYSYLNC